MITPVRMGLREYSFGGFGQNLTWIMCLAPTIFLIHHISIAVEKISVLHLKTALLPSFADSNNTARPCDPAPRILTNLNPRASTRLLMLPGTSRPAPSSILLISLKGLVGLRGTGRFGSEMDSSGKVWLLAGMGYLVYACSRWSSSQCPSQPRLKYSK